MCLHEFRERADKSTGHVLRARPLAVRREDQTAVALSVELPLTSEHHEIRDVVREENTRVDRAVPQEFGVGESVPAQFVSADSIESIRSESWSDCGGVVMI